MIFVSGEELRHLVPMSDAISSVREAFIRVTDGRAEQPLRLGLGDASALAMMARGDKSSGTVAKLVSIRQQNRRRGLPTIQALAVWFDADTGTPRFVVDGATLTSIRTGAASGVASDLLAPADASTLALIGAGAQAADQFRAICAVRAIRDTRIASRTESSADALAATLSREFPTVSVRACSSVAEAVAGAEIICCATNSTEPVLSVELLADRVHVNAIGSYRPEMRELAEDVLTSASILVVDETHAATTEAGEIVAAIRSGAILQESLIELGKLALEAPRVSGRTVFKSVGIAIQDWAIAQAIETRLGPLDGDGALPTAAHAAT